MLMTTTHGADVSGKGITAVPASIIDAACRYRRWFARRCRSASDVSSICVLVDHPKADVALYESACVRVRASLNDDHPTCPITGERILVRTLTPSGHEYERNALIRWLRLHGTDPMTREPLNERDLAFDRFDGVWQPGMVR